MSREVTLTLINGCPARALHRLELKRPSPQGTARVRVYQIAPQHGKGNSAQPCAHILLSPEGLWEKTDKKCPPLAKCARKLCVAPIRAIHSMSLQHLSSVSFSYVWFPACWAPLVAERLFWLVVQSRGDFLFSAWAACFRAFLSTSLGKRLLVLVGPSQMGMAPRWCIKSDNGHCQVRQSCWCSMSAAEFSGLSWMIKLFWTAILCYRKASCAMFSRAGCRPSTYGWRSSCAGTCWLTGCTHLPDWEVT